MKTTDIPVEWLGRTSYATALDLQSRLVADYLAGAGTEKILLLEHEPVYTIGRTRDQSSLREPSTLPHPVFETNRGGQATWHGPGQLVAYPILDLQNRGKDLHNYMRFLEEIVILTCGEFGCATGRSEGQTGVWIGPKKIASIGVGVRRWVTMHGLALNVGRPSLEAFNHITPCGIAGVEMTCIEKEIDRPITVAEVGRKLGEILLCELPSLTTEPGTQA